MQNTSSSRAEDRTAVHAGDLQFTMTAPCKRCPFRTDIRPYLRKGAAREIIDCLIAKQGTFTCHETTVCKEDDHGDSYMVEGPNAQHCAGAMIMLEHMNQPNQMMRICERIGCYDRRKLKMESPVFRTGAAFIRAQR